MHLQRADELPARDVAVLVLGQGVALAWVELADHGRERMRAGGGQATDGRGGRGEVAAGGGELCDRGGHRVRGGQAQLQLSRRELELEARVRGGLDHLAGAWQQIERMRIEQHQLLLQPERERRGASKARRRAAAEGVCSEVTG